VTRPLVGDWRSILSAAGDVELIGTLDGVPRDKLLEALPGAEALVCLLTDPIDAELLEVGRSLKVVGNCAVGVNNIDLAAAAARGIPVCHTPGVLTEATADLTWGLLLAVARRIVEADRWVREGRFHGWQPGMLLGTELYGKQLGILGFGRIGQAVARRAVGFGMKVSYWSRSSAADSTSTPAVRADLDELLTDSDVVSVHLPLTPETRRLLDAKRLASMKPGAILINTARGPIIDESGLVDVLRNGPLSGAGLDVFENEPEVHPGLLELDNVVLAPHIGSATLFTRSLMVESVCRDVVRVLNGVPPLNRV
jgi:glyoxylate reductase